MVEEGVGGRVQVLHAVVCVAAERGRVQVLRAAVWVAAERGPSPSEKPK